MMVSVIEFMKDIFKYIVIIAVVILLRIYVLATTEVVGPSMEPTLNDGNLLMLEQISARFNKIARFDIVVFKYDSPSYLIKRIIGMPGEKISFKDNELYINNKKVKQSFKFNGEVEDFEMFVEDNMYFVMGDNRNESVDSRSFGLVAKEDIIGQPFMIMWPFEYFEFLKK